MVAWSTIQSRWTIITNFAIGTAHLELTYFNLPVLQSDHVTAPFTDAELEAYLDESLDSSRAAEVEQALRSDQHLLERLSMINSRRDAGIHTLGEIWRRNQIGVPTTETMGNYLLGVLPEDEADYIKFRIEHLKCPFTSAMYRDLEAQQNENAELSKTRREKFYKTSAGLLRKPDDAD